MYIHERFLIRAVIIEEFFRVQCCRGTRRSCIRIYWKSFEFDKIFESIKTVFFAHTRKSSFSIKFYLSVAMKLCIRRLISKKKMIFPLFII